MTAVAVATDFNAVRGDFKEILDRIESEKKALFNPTQIEAVIIAKNTEIEFFKDIYDRGALLVISTSDREANGVIATLKRFMQDAKYAAYQLEAHSYYTVSVWPAM
ncbi:hypothetical protein [Paenibacillus taichungensis]